MKRAGFRLGLAAIILALAVWLWPGRASQHSIDRSGAQVRATQMLATYARHSGDPPAHFIDPVTVDFPDGWEFSWRYRPCPSVARLRIFIHRDGRGDYGETPECHPVRGFGVAPQQV